MKIVSNKLTESETKTINDNIKSLTDQNNALRGLVSVEKQLSALQKQNKDSGAKTPEGFDPTKMQKMRLRLDAFKSGYSDDLVETTEDLTGLTDAVDANSLSMQMAAIKHEDFMKGLEQTGELAKVVAQTLTTSFNAIGVAIGDAFVTEDFGGSTLKFLADFMAIVGSASIALGVAWGANGFIRKGATAVAAGIALIAASRVVGSQAGGGGGGGTVTSSNFNSNGGYQGGAYQFSPTSSYLDVSGLVRGQDIVIATNNTNRNNRRVRK